ncbi:CRISPR-associated protein Csx20 [Treponema sp. TIM-1]|uniref:CRISPR-associated protein Csx20 n=1 Tax=Treponema sp. TIM-1 TaxID=2898417 RepID=UPI003981144B
MAKAFCLLNHALTERQKAELFADFACEELIYPPEAVSRAWSSVSTIKELTYLQLKPFSDWLAGAAAGDVAVLQGEAGSNFALVDFALQKGLVPVHAVTQRIALESRKGEKVRRRYEFEHICFRRYQYFKDYC